jgi:hypothetical protein
MTTRGDREEDVWLSDEQLSKLARADEVDHLHSPVPTRMISNGEHMPIPQTEYPGLPQDKLALARREYLQAGAMPSRTRYGWVHTG